MAQLPNVRDKEASQTFEALPAGDYVVIATESEFRATKAGTGQYLQFTYEILEGPHKARKVWDRFNLINPNLTAVDIAERSLKALQEAVGLDGSAKDSSELHNRPFVVTLKIKQYNGDTSNEVKGYKRIAGEAPKGSAASFGAVRQGPIGPAAPARSAAPPWRR